MTAKQAWRSAWRDARNRRAGRNTSGRYGVQVAQAAQRLLDTRQREEKAMRAAQLLAVPLLPLVLRRKRGGGTPPAAALALAMTLLVMIVGCGGALEPVKRTLALQPGAAGYAVTLVYPGLHVHEAQDLLAQDAAAHGERLACAVPKVRLVSAQEETAPPEGAEPKSTTKVEGLLSCGALEVSAR